MIGYNALGRNGRLGNQMFQYAALKGIAAYRGYEYCIPPQEFEPNPQNHLLFDFFEMPDVKHIQFMPSEPTIGCTFEFHESLFYACPDNVNLAGYFQTEKYFQHIATDIKRDFTFKQYIQQKAESYLNQLKKNYGEKLVCLSVRRGDYLHYPDHHPVCSLDYYQEALSRFDSDTHVVVISDDKEWVSQQELFTGERFHITNRDFHYIIDMCITSMIDNHIISNSTFSWWGAWLSNKKQVIAPLKWFGTAYHYLDTKDLIPSEWERI